MVEVIKQPNWKHVTFKTPKINFLNWASHGVKISMDGNSYEFKSKLELEALMLSIQPSYKGGDTCFITTDELRSIHVKTKERMDKIKLLNGDVYNKPELLKKMYDDSFYYGELGKYALSSSAIKNLIDSPKSYARSLNYNNTSEPNAFKIGRLIHLAALEPEKIDTLCHVVEVQSAVTKKFKEKVAEVGSPQFVFTRKEYDKAMYTVDALLQNDVWQDMTRNAEFEKPGFDVLDGYPFRGKADVIGFDYIADLKTTGNLKDFKWSAKKYGYDAQAYIYCNLFNIDYKNFHFFAIDKGTGDLGIYDITENFYNSGKDKVQYGIKVFEKYFVNKEDELNSYIIKDILD